ncbi:MAG: hypothetical protein JSS53_05005 [Proteobacteria bacterium]|nr:hypothetical protein [Pseudomonadota bacterium]
MKHCEILFGNQRSWQGRDARENTFGFQLATMLEKWFFGEKQRDFVYNRTLNNYNKRSFSPVLIVSDSHSPATVDSIVSKDFGSQDNSQLFFDLVQLEPINKIDFQTGEPIFTYRLDVGSLVLLMLAIQMMAFLLQLAARFLFSFEHSATNFCGKNSVLLGESVNRFGIYAYNAKEYDIAPAMASVAAGTVTEKAVEIPGKYLVNKLI